ncbi:heterokaryon incompatibility protein-domain-containing protein, partial [Fusarium flagelliforme]
MSENPGTELHEQVNDPINKPKIGSVLHPQQSGCPIVREITDRLRLPSVVAKTGAVDVGGVCLSRDDFCPESAHCVLCSFVNKIRPAGTNNASPRSVHFVLNRPTNDILRRNMDTQVTSETPPLGYWDADDYTIVVTNGAKVFQTIDWFGRTIIEHRPEHESESCILRTFCFWRYEAPSPNLLTPKLDTLTYITNQAKHWLCLCDESHGVCKSLVSKSTTPISLIDCNRHCLVHGSQESRYVALSYVWGKAGRSFNLPERKYGVPLHGLPRTISDAIAVTKSLEYEYLWVDMLCIDQESKEDKHRQIAIMDQIYRSADFTIIVAAGSDCGDGIPGVSERRRPPRLSITIGNTILVEDKENAVKEIEASIWRSRGWTFQEGLLSRRRLVFTNTQMLFSCLSNQASEPKEGPEFSHQASEVNDLPSTIFTLHERDSLWDTSFLQTNRAPHTTLIGNGRNDFTGSYGFPISFAELLQKYSTLDFSFESDIVNAFRAIGNTFALKTPPVLHLHGLPFIFSNEPMTASSLTHGLAWHLERGNGEAARRPDFPSWSWLGYRGPVRWSAFHRDGATIPIGREWCHKTFSHLTSMITLSNRRFEPLQLSQWWREWSSARASEGLAPSRLMILGPMITKKVWFDAECTPENLELPTRYTLTGKEAWFPIFQYKIGESLLMSLETCHHLLENLRRGNWRALLLTDDFLLIIQFVAADTEDGPYRRVGSADINIFTAGGRYRMGRDHFVKECTELVDIEL